MFEKLRLLAHILLGLNFILFISKFSKGNKLYKIFTFYLGLIVLIEIIINREPPVFYGARSIRIHFNIFT